MVGNPHGRKPLGLPKPREVETHIDPKRLLADCLLKAAEVTGRRHERVANRFNQHRRQLLERLDPSGPIQQLPSWKRLVADIDAIVRTLGDDY